MYNIRPYVSIVGAGPGDPDLMTVKGMRAIENADVILYDALVNKQLLRSAPQTAKLIFVGKRANKHSYSQEEINKMIVSSALQYGHAVRLKGGDPFVFGRGHEELQYVESFNIPVTVIPGISSSIAVPELQGVPVTKRGVSQSFWVLTATNKDGKFVSDLSLAARSSATLVVLMGLRKLPLIVREFAKLGKLDMPIMIVQNGSLPSQKCVTGKMSDIETTVAKEQLGTPAIIVIGKVVELHPANALQMCTTVEC